MPSNYFIDRLIANAARCKSLVIIGLDPIIGKFPAYLRSRLSTPATDDEIATIIAEFNVAIIEATMEHAAAYKPQVAFYEQYGIGGFRGLEFTLAYLREHDIPFIIDAKRGDIQSTAEAYARAWLGETLETGARNTLRSDAITVNPYLGLDGVLPFLNESSNAGIFLLAKTSNPSSGDLQDLILLGGQTVYEKVACLAAEWSDVYGGPSSYSRIGLVVGATYSDAALRIRSIAPKCILLMPGVGAQGGSAAAVKSVGGSDGYGAFAAISRALLYCFAAEDLDGSDWRVRLDTAVQTTLKAEWLEALQL
jgi:orotidine-5'-phosphate decarboxylase